MKNLWLLLFLLASSNRANAQSVSKIAFRFHLGHNAATSAGVFNSSMILIRTLWSNRQYVAGWHSETWDGNTDSGLRAKSGTYTVKILQSNATYTWGVVGNTEESWTDSNYWSAFGFGLQSLRMTFVDSKGWLVSGYAEGTIGLGYIDDMHPNRPIVFNKNFSNQNIALTDIQTDGKRIYVMNTGAWSGVNFVTSFDGHSGAPAYFTNGILKVGSGSGGNTPVDTYKNMTMSVIDQGSLNELTPTGLAVQRRGNLLAVAHGDFDRSGFNLNDPRFSSTVVHSSLIRLFDKNSGSLLGTISSVPNPKNMAFSSAGLWVISNGSLVLITDLGKSNTITTPIRDLSKAVAVAVNGTNDHIFVLDGGMHQQMKEYDALYNLVRSWGTLGGYTDCNPTVTNQRLLLDSTATTGTDQLLGSWLTVEDSGAVWIGDGGNNGRVLHISNANKYINQIEDVHPNYSATASRSNPSRVFIGMFEYAIDYSKPLLPGDPDPIVKGNGSWILSKNWSVCSQGAAGSTARELFGAKSVETLSNGRTYGQFQSHGNSFFDYELPENGSTPLRYTGLSYVLGQTIPLIAADGSLYYEETTGRPSFQQVTIYKRPLNGFDRAGNPIWASAVPMASTKLDASMDPTPSNGWGQLENYEPTRDGIFPIFMTTPHNQLNTTNFPHLAGLKSSGIIFRVMPEKCIALPDHQGSFPCKAGYGGHAGITAAVQGNKIIVGYDGQYATWGDQFYLFQDDGLLIGQFGGSGYGAVGVSNPPYAAGNIASMYTVTVKGNIYVYNTDEAIHTPLGRWQIGNLESVQELKASGAMGAVLTLR